MRGWLVVALWLGASTAQAQLDLSGATPAAPAGTVVAPLPGPAKPRAPRPKVAPPSAPAETALAGKTLSLNGGRSQITFAARDKTVEVSRLLLVGHKLSNARDECQVDLSGGPFAVTPLGRSNGVSRFSVAATACPFSFDVLDGAVLTAADSAACTFQAADCQATVVGLWGAQPGDLGPDQVKTIERERTAAERTVRESYKGLVTSTKDRTVIRGYASDQAGFSSHREEMCRDYIGESRHGFCAARLTEERAVALEAQLATAAATKEARRKKRVGHGTP